MTNKKIIRLPITNVYAKGDYCVTLHIGSEQSPVNLILDTGSSTLVIKEQSYQADKDKSLSATSLAQEVNYGIGGWNGPVIKTKIGIGATSKNGINDIANTNNALTLEQSHLALVANNEQQKTFGLADGILGLAYHHLNKGFDLINYLKQNNITPAQTYPWPFAAKKETENEVENKIKSDVKNNSNNLTAFKRFLWQNPEHNITPYFTELEEHNLTANKFSFYSQRSSVYMSKKDESIDESKQHPLNQGLLILGGGEEATDLYQGDFKSIKVEHDIYYNVELLSIQVAGNTPHVAPKLQAEHQKAYLTNAIIDTGAGGIVLTAALYQKVINDLITHNENFKELLTPFKEISAQETGIDASLIDLAQWPDIHFTFVGKNTENPVTSSTKSQDKEQITLTCSPSTYWQLNTPQHGKACFRMLSQLPQWPNQSIMGLPLLNNYFVIFDRSVHNTGVVKFARQIDNQE